MPPPDLPIPAPAGPLVHATLIVADAAPCIAAYGGLGLRAIAGGTVGTGQAAAWGQPQLAGGAVTWLAPRSPASFAAAPLLRLITVPGTLPRPTRFSQGWLALEILVRDVDALAPRVAAAGFEIVGPPADLDVSPAIRAMQAIGPAGELLYLTQVKSPVPPFVIPLSADLPVGIDIGPLFIAVLSTPSREAVIEACSPLHPAAVLRFDTRITVLNRALGRDLAQRWPVATVQWGGHSLFEIDEVVDAAVQNPTNLLPAGLAWVSMRAGPDPSPRPHPSAAGWHPTGAGAGEGVNQGLMLVSPAAWIEVLR